jgi:putative membrane protein insertion efficiency factor
MMRAVIPHTLYRWAASLLRLLPVALNVLLMAVVRAYRFFLSPWLGSACRFTPTCSAYALAALQTHGPVAGSYLAAHRLLRCHPGCAGGHDPVPMHLSGLLSRCSSYNPSSDSPRS